MSTIVALGGGAPSGAGADQQTRDRSRSASASPTGRCAAAGRRTAPARRSSDSARCAPRLFGAIAWISSTITVRVVASIGAAGFGAEQDVERFRRGDDDVRRAAAHALALGRRRVAGAHPGADFDVGQPLRAQGLADAGERRLQIALDVVGQRLQRRDVDDLRFVGERARRGPRRTSPSIAARNAASVLPEPVGAAISV